MAEATVQRPRKPCARNRGAWSAGASIPSEAEQLAAADADRKYWEAYRDEKRAKALDYLATLPILAFQTGAIRILETVQANHYWTP